MMRGMVAAVASRDWMSASTKLRGSSFCAADATRCERLATQFQAGCPEVDHFSEPPVWGALNAVECTSTASPTVLCMDVHISVLAELRCSGATVSVTLPLVQPSVTMTFVPTTGAAAPTESLSLATVPVHLESSSGQLLVDSTAARWWSSYSQVALNAGILEAIQVGGATTLCSASASASALEAYAAAVLAANPDAPLVVNSISATPTSMSAALLAARRLSTAPHRPVMLSHANGCAMACSAGSALQPFEHAGAASTAVCPALNASTTPLEHCLNWLDADYATCDLPKAQSDARFAACIDRAGLCPSSSSAVASLPEWWAACVSADAQAPSPSLPAEPLLAAVLECATFARAQQLACQCSPASSGVASPPPAASEVAEIQAGAACLASSVGPARLMAAENHPDDLRAVATRLDQLGYLSSLGLLQGHGFQREHSMRLLSCAAVGVLGFEDQCEVPNWGICRVGGVVCPAERTVIERGTCLRENVDCGTGLFASGSVAHGWLVARNAPGWRELPQAGCGFELLADTADERFRRFGTSWLADAMVAAGRIYVQGQATLPSGDDAQAPAPLRFVAASVREGGALMGGTNSTPRTFQTGLELEVLLQPGAQAVAEVAALIAAGFAVFDDAECMWASSNLNAEDPTPAQCSPLDAARTSTWRVAGDATPPSSARADGLVLARVQVAPPTVDSFFGPAATHAAQCATRTVDESATPVPASAQEIELLSGPLSELQLLAQGLEATLETLVDAWGQRPLERAVAVERALPQARGLLGRLLSTAPAARRLADIAHTLEKADAVIADPVVEVEKQAACARVRSRTASFPPLPDDPSALLSAFARLEAQIAIFEHDVIGGLANASAAVVASATSTEAPADAIRAALALFAPANLGMAMGLLSSAASHRLSAAPAVLERLLNAEAVRNDSIHGESGVSSFLAQESERTRLTNTAREKLASLSTMHAPSSASDHWVNALEGFTEVDTTWERLWIERMVGKTVEPGSYEFDIELYRQNNVELTRLAPVMMRAAALGKRLQVAVSQTFEHVSSPFFADLAALVQEVVAPELPPISETRLLNVDGNLTALTIPDVAAAVQVVTDLLADPIKTAQAASLGGELIDLEGALALVRDQLMPYFTPHQVIKLQAFAVKARNELDAAYELERHEATLVTVREYAAQVEGFVCSQADALDTDEAELEASNPRAVSRLSRATDRLFDPTGAPSRAFAEVRRLAGEAGAIRTCAGEAADAGVVEPTESGSAEDDPYVCHTAQSDLLKAAARLASEYVEAIEAIQASFLATLGPHASNAAPRASQWIEAGRSLAGVGAWSRSLSQPGTLAVQLARGACRAPRTVASHSHAQQLYESDCAGMDATAPAAAISSVIHAMRLRSWPSELEKASEAQQVIADELSTIAPKAYEVVGVFATLQGKFATARDVSTEMAAVTPSVNMLKAAGVASRNYANELAARLDRIARHLNGAPEVAYSSFVTDGGQGVFSPPTVWHQPARSSAWEGPHFWLESAAGLTQLSAAYALAKRDSSSCVVHSSDDSSPGGVIEARIDELSSALDEFLIMAFSSQQVPYVLVSGTMQAHMAEVACLVQHYHGLFEPLVTFVPAGFTSPPAPPSPPPSLPDGPLGLIARADRAKALEVAALRSDALDRCQALDWMAAGPEQVSTATGRMPLCAVSDTQLAVSTARDGAEWCQLPGNAQEVAASSGTATSGSWMYQQCYPLFARYNLNAGIASSPFNTPVVQRSEQDKWFRKEFVPFHYATMKPISPIGANLYKRINFRFTVPMLNSKFSMQSSTFLNLEWPLGGNAAGVNCEGCPENCPTGCSCTVGPSNGAHTNNQPNGGCFGVCGPNGVNMLPKNYLFTYKYESLATVSQSEPMGGKASVIARTNAKGAIAQTWMVVVPANVDWAGTDTQEWDCSCTDEPAIRLVLQDGAHCDQSAMSPEDWCAAKEQTCKAKLFDSDSAHPAKAVPYYGSLTGVAVTKPPSAATDDMKEAQVCVAVSAADCVMPAKSTVLSLTLQTPSSHRCTRVASPIPVSRVSSSCIASSLRP